LTEEEKFLIFYNEFLGDLDELYSIRDSIVEGTCGIKYEDYHTLFTRELLEMHFDRLLNFSHSNEAEEIIYYNILAILIFETGSDFPEKVKHVILNKKLDWFYNYNAFRERVRNYIPGNPLIKARLDLSKRNLLV